MATTDITTQTPGRRMRSEGKRAAILTAAEALFVTDGYELTSVDAIAARAAVSKRTVYDHFGGKGELFQAVLGRVADAVVATVRAAIDQELTQGRDLRDGLTAFAIRVATETFPSSDYVIFRRLTTQHRSVPRLPETAGDEPRRLLEQRFAALAADGELRTSDPRRATQHFTALTFRLALDAIDEDPAKTSHESETVAIITDGIDVFLRAYR